MRVRTIDHLNTILSRPLMYAATREGFVGQVACLLEVLGVRHNLYDVFKRPGSAAAIGTNKFMTTEWAAPIVERVRTLLKEAEVVS